MKIHNQSGYTLVELMVVIMITAVLSTVILGFMADQIRGSVIASAKATLLRESQQGLDAVGRDIRLSANADQNNRWQDAYAPNPADPYSWQGNSSTLILATASQDSSKNILFDDPSKYITAKDNHIYFVRNGTLYKRILASDKAGNAAVNTCPSANASSTCPADEEILHNVTAFSVQYHDGADASVSAPNARSVILNIQLKITKYGQDITSTTSTRMVFRND